MINVELIREILAIIFLLYEGICDLRKREISWIGIGFAILSAILLLLFRGNNHLIFILLGLLPGIFIFILAFVSGGKIGYGDGVVCIALGLLLGIKKLLFVLLGGLWLCALLSIVLLLLKKANSKSTFPFVPFMVMPAVILLLIG